MGSNNIVDANHYVFPEKNNVNIGKTVYNIESIKLIQLFVATNIS